MLHKCEEFKLVRLLLLLVWFLFPEILEKGTSEHNQHRIFTGWECWMLFLTPKQQCQTTDFNNAKIINWMRSFSFSLHRLIPMEGDATPFMGN